MALRQRVMPAGDSITWGYDPADAGIPSPLDVGWRLRCWAQLDPPYDVDMVGAEVSGLFDEPQHEGHPGINILGLTNILTAKVPAFSPQIMCLMIGTNDAFSDTASVMLAHLDALLGVIVTAVPLCYVLVSPIPPIRDSLLPGVEAGREAYNAGIPGLVSARAAAGQRVQLVHAGDLLAVTDLPDGVHPTTPGYTVMGDAWAAAIRPLLAVSQDTVPSPELPRVGCAGVDISWDGSAAYTGPVDDVTAWVAGDPGVSGNEGRDGQRALAPPRIASGSLDLFNHTGRWSQERPDSPVYQRFVPARPVRLRYALGTRRPYRAHVGYRAHVAYRGIAVMALGSHLIDDIRQTTAWGNQRVSLTTIGQESVLTKSTVFIGVQQNVKTSDCVTLILNAAGWPADKRAVSIGDTTLLWWWCDERVPWDALLELVQAEGATAGLYLDKTGVLHFENRNYRTTAVRSVTSQASFYDHTTASRTLYRQHVTYRGHRTYRGATSGFWFTDLTYDPGFKSIYNRATYTTRRRVPGTPGSVIWTYGASLNPATGVGTTLIAKFNDPVVSIVNPVLGTDYTVAGGTVTVSVTSGGSGLVAYVTATAISGSPTITGLQLRGTPLTVVSETVVVNAADAAASIGRYSPVPGAGMPITLDVQGWPEIDGPNAQAVCDSWVLRYRDPHPSVSISLRNGTGGLLDQILHRTPSDRITVVERNTGLSADVFINAIERSVGGAAGTVVTAVFDCEKADTIGGAVWDLAVWDDPSAIWGV